ncbi:unnamed protein product [Linum tenue]|uniref:Uncharacterized protein n=1 Tax=Linum tenue TaxID=586396 RepID=A0AAV0JNB2_9ROSI|nr:unnamed protein product [Linum tenue]
MPSRLPWAARLPCRHSVLRSIVHIASAARSNLTLEQPHASSTHKIVIQPSSPSSPATATHGPADNQFSFPERSKFSLRQTRPRPGKSSGL